jgi:hypothetical protein
MAVSAMDGYALMQVYGGVRVDRAASNIAQSGTLDLFTVAGGRVLVWMILGQVTTIIQAQADAVKLIAHPTTGSDVDLCATADINGLEVGGKLSLNGTLATALGKTLAGAAAGLALPVIIDPGVIRMNAAASNTGQIKWTLWYMPIDQGASVVAA